MTNSLPLDGFRVLDLTRFLAGPYCTMVLAELGAAAARPSAAAREGAGVRFLTPPLECPNRSAAGSA